MEMPMAAWALALSPLEGGVVDCGGAAAPVMVAVRELVGDAVVGDEDADDEVGGAGEEKDGEGIPLVEDRPAVELEAPVGTLVILGPHVCGDMASFDVIVNWGVLPQSTESKSSSCI